MLLAGPVFHTSTQYIDYVEILPFILLILVGAELPLCIVVNLSLNAVMFSGVKLSIKSFGLFS